MGPAQAILCLLLSLLNLSDVATTQPAGVGAVTGKITVATGQIPEMVVYLEPVDPNVRFTAPSQPAVISQRGAKFSPSLLVVAVGQAVDFRNDEDRPIEHNVFSRSPAKQFDLGLYRPPEGKLVVFDQPGPVKLYCSIHRYMDGMIYVCPTPFFATVSPDGSFEITNVPRGEYRLKTWQRLPRFEEVEVPLRIEGGAATVELEMKRG